MTHNYTEASRLKQRSDLDKIIELSESWQMEFNVDKCTVIHMGRSNMEHNYRMGENNIRKIDKERDLGVIIDHTGKVSEQVKVAVKKANAMLGMIKRNIKHRSKEVIVKLYKALVRPRLEYCVQVWSPYHRGDINMLERIQKRATKMIVGFQNYSYEERLRKTGLQCLEERRIRGDLIQVYKMIRGMDKLDYNKFFFKYSHPQ